MVATRSNPQVIGFIPVAGLPYETNMQWNLAEQDSNLYPTARLDAYPTSKLHYSTAWNMYRWHIGGFPYYPDAPVPSWNTNNNAQYISPRYVLTNAFDYTITPHLLNNFTLGIQSNNEYYNKPADPHMWDGYGYGGQIITLPIFSAGTLMYTGLPDGRNNPVVQVHDTVSWVRGRHTMSMGTAFLDTWFFEIAYGGAGVPNIGLGVATNDPVNSLFTTTTLPFINSNNSDIANAKALYAMLTGRISSYSANRSVDEKTHQYLPFAPGTQRFRHKTLDFFGSYDLPIGRGRLVNVNSRALNAAIGGWTIGTVNTISSGAPTTLTGGRLTFNAFGSTTFTGADGGVIFGNGLSMDSLLNATSTQVGGFDKACTCIHTNVSGLTLSNGVVNPAYLQAAQTPGVIGSPVWYVSKTSFTLNLSVAKNFRFTERVNLRLYAEASNWLNHPFFAQGSLTLTGSTFGAITSASGSRTMILRWSLDF